MPKILLSLLALPPEGSTISSRIDALHLFVITTTMVSSLLVFAIAAYFVVRYKRKHDAQLTERVTASVLGEGSLIAFILGLFVVWWVIGFRQYVEMREPPDGAMTVYVTAKQWMWKFTYPDGRSANDVLTIPVGRPVKLAMTSRDVIHSFYVPGFRTKMDVLPGRYTTEWFEPTKPGEYPIYCAEFCGVSHSRMRGTVVVLSAADYARWLDQPGRDVSGEHDLVARGAEVARRRECLACHTVTGEPHVGPTWVGLFGSEQVMSDGRRVVADEAYLTRSMMEPQVDVVSGYKPVMPSYYGVLPQPEVAALVEYIKSLRDAGPQSGVVLPKLDVTPASRVDPAGPAGPVTPPDSGTAAAPEAP